MLTFLTLRATTTMFYPRIFSGYFIYGTIQRFCSKSLCHTYFTGRFLTLESSFSSIIRILYASKSVTLPFPRSSHTYSFQVGFSRVPLSTPISTRLRWIGRTRTCTIRIIYYNATVCCVLLNTHVVVHFCFVHYRTSTVRRFALWPLEISAFILQFQR